MSETSPLPLAGLQRWMQAVLINPLGTGSQAHQELPQHLHQGTVEALICDSKRLTAREHLAVYQRGYLQRLRGCMSKQFPALEFALGEALFQQFADQYLQAYPPVSYTLTDLGRRFPDYLEETRPDKDNKEAWPDFLIELAAFEYAVTVLFDAQEPAEDVAKAGLRLNPILALFQHRFPVLDYYRAVMAEQKPQLPLESPTHAAIVRKNYRLKTLALQPAQYLLLKYVQAGNTLEGAIQKLETHGVQRSELEKVLPQWMAWWRENHLFH